MSINTLTSFSFAGNPSTNAAKFKALAHGGPLVVATDHRLHAMMPDAFNDAANAGKTVLMADFEAMFMDAMLIDTEVTRCRPVPPGAAQCRPVPPSVEHIAHTSPVCLLQLVATV